MLQKATDRIKGLVLLLLLTTILINCQSEPQIPKIVGEVDISPYGPGDMVIDSSTGYVYVLSGHTAVTVLNGLEKISTLPAGRRSDSLAVDQDRGWVYVANEYSDNVTVIQENEVIATIKTTGENPNDIAIDPQSGWVYVVTGYETPPDGYDKEVAGNVTILQSAEVIGTMALGRVLPTHIVADPVNGYIYIGDSAGWVIVIQGMKEITRFDVGSTVSAMDVDPNTGDVYVLNRASDRNLTQFRKGELIAIAEIEEEGGSVGSMKVHPVTGDVYVVDWVRREAIVVRNMRVIGRVPVGSGGVKMAIDPITGNVYVANFEDDTVTVIHGTEAIATLEVGWYPYGIGVNPTNGWVYVSNTNDDTITVFGFEE